MIDRYRDDDRICYITANNESGISSGQATYFFSHYGGSWGWATWKRVWNLYDFILSDFNQQIKKKSYWGSFDSYFERLFWTRRFRTVYKGGGNTYDYQAKYLIHTRNMLNIYPNVNLVTNIGWDEQGSNTKGYNEKFANKPITEIDQIIHPNEIKRDEIVDNKIFRYHFVNKSPLEYMLRWKYAEMMQHFSLKANV